MHISPRITRLAGAVGILFLPLGLLMVGLLVRLATLAAYHDIQTAPHSFDIGVNTAVRWFIVAGLGLVAVAVAAPLVRRRPVPALVRTDRR